MTISKCKCIGAQYGVSKKNDNKPYTVMYFDVTAFQIGTFKGTIVCSLFKWDSVPDCVGVNFTVVVDNFGKVIDIITEKGE